MSAAVFFTLYAGGRASILLQIIPQTFEVVHATSSAYKHMHIKVKVWGAIHVLQQIVYY